MRDARRATSVKVLILMMFTVPCTFTKKDAGALVSAAEGPAGGGSRGA